MNKRGNFDKKRNFKRFNRGRGGGGGFHKRNRDHNPHQKREYRHHDQLKESEVGITLYISKLEGFSGVIKARFSDFQVNEINLEGKIAKLTDTSIPKDFAKKMEKINYKEVEQSPTDLIPQDIWEAIKQNVCNAEAEPVNLNAENLSKEERKAIHGCVKSHFGQKIIASTVTIENKKFMQFKKYDKEVRQDTRFQWPEDKDEWVYFLVYKEACDTMDACLKISDYLRMSPSDFSYAGVKDKRAKTTQWFCARKVEPWKLIIKTKPVRNIKIGNFEFKKDMLKMGQLSGNRFRIALRNITVDDKLINDSMKQVQDNGFINYYGLQRFGNEKEAPTFLVGIHLLLGKWKEAVSLILKPKASDDAILDITKAKKIYHQTADAKAALKELESNRNKCVEARLLEGLTKNHGSDFVNALENIPRNMRLLYLHSFQSLIWNKMVTKRLEEFGFEPVEGDLVLLDEEEKCDIDIEESVNSQESDTDFKCKQNVKAITADELSQYTIYDVVLPLPGYDVTYPEHMKQYYKDVLEEHGLSLEMPKQPVKTYNLCGNYRKIRGQVKNLSWKIMQYNEPTDDLIRSDFDELRGMPELQSIENGKYKALVMEFDLNPASYATMVLREILKSETSSSAQAKLNDYHEDKKKKIILDDTVDGENVQETEENETVESSSLLANKEKYEEFKNNIFKSILETPTKRKNEDNQEDESSSKRSKEDKNEEQTKIEMEASLV